MKYNHKELSELIVQASNELQKHPQEITKSDILKTSKTTAWDLRVSLEGTSLKAIQNRYFPVTTKDLVEIKETQEVNKYVRILETKLATRESLEKKLMVAVQNNIQPIPKILPRKFKPTATDQERQIVLM